MTTKNVVFVRKPFLSGISKPLTFRIADEDHVGFKPDALTMSIYDAAYPYNDQARICGHPVSSPTPAIVNSRNDDDVSAYCDVNGNVEVMLDPADTNVTLTVQTIGQRKMYVFRHVLFTATFGSPEQVEKLLYILTILPDQETIAS